MGTRRRRRSPRVERATMPLAATAGGPPYAKRKPTSRGRSGRRLVGGLVPQDLPAPVAPPLLSHVQVRREPDVGEALDVTEQLVEHCDARVAADAERMHDEQEAAADLV